MTSRWLDGSIDRSDGFPRPDWAAVGRRLETEAAEPERDAAVRDAVLEWLAELRETLGPRYRVDPSPRFLLLSPFDARTAGRVVAFLADARRQILEGLLRGVAADDPGLPHVAIVFADDATYTSYVDWFHAPGGEYARTGGMYLHGPGPPHFVVCGAEPLDVERTVTHELTHACLAHLPIPVWLNEGIATTVESAVMRDGTMHVTRDDLDDHRACWGGGGIQEFWSGVAYERADDRSRLAYPLAAMAVTALSHRAERFRAFVLAAVAGDAGEAACVAHYGGGLGGLVAQFLGPGDWDPRPETWDGRPHGADDPAEGEEGST